MKKALILLLLMFSQDVSGQPVDVYARWTTVLPASCQVVDVNTELLCVKNDSTLYVVSARSGEVLYYHSKMHRKLLGANLVDGSTRIWVVESQFNGSKSTLYLYLVDVATREIVKTIDVFSLSRLEHIPYNVDEAFLESSSDGNIVACNYRYFNAASGYPPQHATFLYNSSTSTEIRNTSGIPRLFVSPDGTLVMTSADPQQSSGNNGSYSYSNANLKRRAVWQVLGDTLRNISYITDCCVPTQTWSFCYSPTGVYTLPSLELLPHSNVTSIVRPIFHERDSYFAPDGGLYFSNTRRTDTVKAEFRNSLDNSVVARIIDTTFKGQAEFCRYFGDVPCAVFVDSNVAVLYNLDALPQQSPEIRIDWPDTIVTHTITALKPLSVCPIGKSVQVNTVVTNASLYNWNIYADGGADVDFEAEIIVDGVDTMRTAWKSITVDCIHDSDAISYAVLQGCNSSMSIDGNWISMATPSTLATINTSKNAFEVSDLPFPGQSCTADVDNSGIVHGRTIGFESESGTGGHQNTYSSRSNTHTMWSQSYGDTCRLIHTAFNKSESSGGYGPGNSRSWSTTFHLTPWVEGRGCYGVSRSTDYGQWIGAVRLSDTGVTKPALVCEAVPQWVDHHYDSDRSIVLGGVAKDWSGYSRIFDTVSVISNNNNCRSLRVVDSAYYYAFTGTGKYIVTNRGIFDDALHLLRDTRVFPGPPFRIGRSDYVMTINKDSLFTWSIPGLEKTLVRTFATEITKVATDTAGTKLMLCFKTGLVETFDARAILSHVPFESKPLKNKQSDRLSDSHNTQPLIPVKSRSFSAYPNPCSNSLTIEGEIFGSAPVEVKITSPVGTIVNEFTVERLAGYMLWNVCDYNGTPLSPGMYVCSATSNGQIFSTSICVIH